MSIAPFFSRLEARCTELDTLLCVGLDPHSTDLGNEVNAAGAEAFCLRLITASAPYAAAFKPNCAFFEVFGAAGVAALERVCVAVKATGALLVVDGKRGDIATTAEAYAAAAFAPLGGINADAVTVNAYMGADAVTPFTAYPGRGVFVLCKTSNKSSDELQTLRVGDKGEKLFERVARFAAGAWAGPEKAVGLVVGATDSAALASARAAAPDVWILAPGVGFQGGDLGAALKAGLRADGLGLLIPVSRGVSRSSDPAVASRDLRDSINLARKSALTSSTDATIASSSSSSSTLSPHARFFLSAALNASVLRFGEFTLKSGRLSPYFFNAGNFRSGAALAALGRTYAAAIMNSGIEFDVLFGPAYKGIPLVTTAACALSDVYDRDYPVTYNRKEVKDHGEGGTTVGADLKGTRVLIIDDVISAGTAVGESVALVRAAGGIPVGVIIGLDRQEKGSDDSSSAVQQVTKLYNIPVFAVATLDGLIGFLHERLEGGGVVSGVSKEDLPTLLERVRSYRTQWGVGGGVM
jgi:uridine monophosphate synthetase